MKRIALTLMPILLMAFPMISQIVPIPDTAFLHALIDEGVDTNEDSLISYDEAEATINLNVSEKGISDMTGIDAFVKLEEFICDCNPITFIDVSENIALKRLAVRNFSSMDSWCNGPYLTSLDVSNNTAIDLLVCGGNLLTRLDISNNIHLADSKKSLAELGLGRMPSLHEVCVWEGFLGTVWFDTTDSPNVYFTTECIYNNDSIVFIPDTAFLNALIEKGVDSDGDSLISYTEAESVSQLDISGLGGQKLGGQEDEAIKDLTGIEAFTNMNFLNVSFHPISNLDVSKCVNLSHLSCVETKIANLDVSGCTKLISLECGSLWKFIIGDTLQEDNGLVNLDISNNPYLELLHCYGNRLETLDVSNNSSLSSLNCSYNSNLSEVCVWTMPFPPSGVIVDTTDSPNVYFTTECGEATYIEESSQSELSIYPNPTNSLLTIETEYPDHYSIGISSLNGQQILTEEMKGTSRQIDLSSFSKGVYFITIRSEDFVTTRKIIKL